MKEVQMPCPIIAWSMGQIATEIRQAAASTEKEQMEKSLFSLEQLYEKQCGGKKVNYAQEAHFIGLRVSMKFTNEAVFVNLATTEGNVVAVILGGKDGDLITIDGKGIIRRLPPEGPGDPEIRQAMASVRQVANVLSGAVAAGV